MATFPYDLKFWSVQLKDVKSIEDGTSITFDPILESKQIISSAANPFIKTDLTYPLWIYIDKLYLNFPNEADPVGIYTYEILIKPYNTHESHLVPIQFSVTIAGNNDSDDEESEPDEDASDESDESDVSEEDGSDEGSNEEDYTDEMKAVIS